MHYLEYTRSGVSKEFSSESFEEFSNFFNDMIRNWPKSDPLKFRVFSDESIKSSKNRKQSAPPMYLRNYSDVVSGEEILPELDSDNLP